MNKQRCQSRCYYFYRHFELHWKQEFLFFFFFQSIHNITSFIHSSQSVYHVKNSVIHSQHEVIKESQNNSRENPRVFEELVIHHNGSLDFQKKKRPHEVTFPVNQWFGFHILTKQTKLDPLSLAGYAFDSGVPLEGFPLFMKEEYTAETYFTDTHWLRLEEVNKTSRT